MNLDIATDASLYLAPFVYVGKTKCENDNCPVRVPLPWLPNSTTLMILSIEDIGSIVSSSESTDTNTVFY